MTVTITPGAPFDATCEQAYIVYFNLPTGQPIGVIGGMEACGCCFQTTVGVVRQVDVIGHVGPLPHPDELRKATAH